MKRHLVSTGSVVAAGLGALPVACCLAPLAAALSSVGLLGVGFALQPYAAALTVASFALLAVGLFLSYRARRGEACSITRSIRYQRALLWSAVVVVTVAALLPRILGYLPLSWVT